MKKYIACVLIFVILLSVSGCKRRVDTNDEPYIPRPQHSSKDENVEPTPKPDNENDAEKNNDNAHLYGTQTLGYATYPDMPTNPDFDGQTSYDEYHNYIKRISGLQTDDSKNAEFFKNTFGMFADEMATSNFVYSPSTLYFSMAMLAETANGNTQRELLNLLGKDSIEQLRENTHNLWQKMYVNNGCATSVMANSIWLKEGVEYNQQTIDILKNKHFASSFSGNFGSEEYTQKIQEWTNEQTRGMLEKQTKAISFEQDTVMALVSTTYLNGKWDSEFFEQNTDKDTFYSYSGDVICDFMHETSRSKLFSSKNFTATDKHLVDIGRMTFILPNEDKTISDILNDDDFYTLLSDNDAQLSSSGITLKDATINLSVPKFDISTTANFTDKLQTLGVNDAFNSASADFSNLTTSAPLMANSISQATRLKIDEKGCEAASFTVSTIISTGAPMQTEIIDFTLDRPFIFVVSGEDNLPRFIGVVNQP